MGATRRTGQARPSPSGNTNSVPSALVDQLVDGWSLIAPVGGERTQTLTRVVRRGDTTSTTPLLTCRFVKLIGADGWSPRVC